MRAYSVLRVLWPRLVIRLEKALKRKEGNKRDDFFIRQLMPLVPALLQTDVLWSELLEAVMLKYQQQKKPPQYALSLTFPKKMKGAKIEVTCSSREEFEAAIFKHFPDAFIGMYSTLKCDPLPDDEPTLEAGIWESRTVLAQIDEDHRERRRLLQERIEPFAALHQIDSRAYWNGLDTDLMKIARREAETRAIGFYRRVFDHSKLEFELDEPRTCSESQSRAVCALSTAVA